MLSQTNLAHIPQDPGVYIFKDHKQQILYIGKAKNLNKRVHQYFAPGSVWKQDMMSKANTVEFVVVHNEAEALILESNMIKQHLPAYNRLLKGDNSYVYLKITNEARPQIFFTRTRKEDGAIYIGPKHMRGELKKLLQYLRQLLGYRGCKTTQFRQGKLCSDYLFGICKGRCVYAKLNQRNAQGYLDDAIKLGFSPDATFQSGRQKSRYMIQLVKDLFDGDSNKILTHISDEIATLIQSQNFEYAATLRDIYRNIDALTQKQSVILDPVIHGTYVLIQQMGGFWVYAILSLKHGKMVDILRFKDSVDEVSLTQILLHIQLEYSEQIEGEILWTQDSVTQYQAWFSDRTPQLSSEYLEILQLHALKFINNFVISDSRQTNSVMNDLLADLQNRYSLSNYPYRVECVDISHLSGGWASGGLSCIVGGMPNKKLYRQYKIPKTIAGDDLASLAYVLKSRFKLESKKMMNNDELPDVLILDGSQLQLGIIKTLCKDYPLMVQYLQKVQICSLAKGSARSSSAKTYGEVEQLIVVQSDLSLLVYDLHYDPTDQILVKLRDEAHRFANRYRTKQMSQEFT